MSTLLEPALNFTHYMRFSTSFEHLKMNLSLASDSLVTGIIENTILETISSGPGEQIVDCDSVSV